MHSGNPPPRSVPAILQKPNRSTIFIINADEQHDPPDFGRVKAVKRHVRRHEQPVRWLPAARHSLNNLDLPHVAHSRGRYLIDLCKLGASCGAHLANSESRTLAYGKL